MRAWLAVLMLALPACDCGRGLGQLGSTDCRTANDCPNRHECRAGLCVPVQIIDGQPKVDAGPSEPCGAREACGAGCCARGEACRDGVCVSGCAKLACDAGSVCDPALEACVQPVLPTTCAQRPPSGPLELVEQWHFAAKDTYRHAIATPVVLDVDGDGVSDVVAPFAPDLGYAYAGVIRALSGVDGRELWRTPAEYSTAAGLAAGDATGTGALAVFALAAEGELVSLSARTGAVRWRRKAGSCVKVVTQLGPAWTALGLADLDADGKPEVTCGLSAFSADTGMPLVEVGGNLAAGYYGPIGITYPLDGVMTAFDGAAGSASGFPAVADLVGADRSPGRDFRPELVLTANGTVSLLDGRTKTWLASTQVPVRDGGVCVVPPAPADVGGAPAVADLDGDGRPEIALAGTQCLSAFAVEPLREGGSQLGLRWSVPIADESSGVSATVAFDVDADGAAEVLAYDEVSFRIFDGRTGATRASVPHCSGTAYEAPVVADLDGDGRAELVLVDNTFAAEALGCATSVKPGIRVLREAKGRLAGARRVWNQSAYHLTNVCDGEDLVCGGPYDPRNRMGAIPTREEPSWAFWADGRDAFPYNGYRLAVGGRFDAANLALGALGADERGCPAELRLSARVENRGARRALAGAEVTFFLDGVELARARTTRPLRPGEFENVSVWRAPPMGGWPRALTAVVTPFNQSPDCDVKDDVAGPVSVRCD